MHDDVSVVQLSVPLAQQHALRLIIRSCAVARKRFAFLGMDPPHDWGGGWGDGGSGGGVSSWCGQNCLVAPRGVAG